MATYSFPTPTPYAQVMAQQRAQAAAVQAQPAGSQAQANVSKALVKSFQPYTPASSPLSNSSQSSTPLQSVAAASIASFGTNIQNFTIQKAAALKAAGGSKMGLGDDIVSGIRNYGSTIAVAGGAAALGGAAGYLLGKSKGKGKSHKHGAAWYARNIMRLKLKRRYDKLRLAV